MKNTRNWLTILILPLIFLSNSALAEFDYNLSAVCKKSAGDTIEVFSGENPFKQSADVSRTGDQCSEIPDAYRINIFKFGILIFPFGFEKLIEIKFIKFTF